MRCLGCNYFTRRGRGVFFFFFGGVGKAVLLVVETNCFSSHILVRVKFEVTGFGSVKRRQLILSKGKLEFFL